MAFAQDIVVDRDPFFTGREGKVTEPFDTRTEAQTYVNSLRSGGEDEFLARAWSNIRIAQNRGPDGRFGEGFTVTITFVRPGPGDDSGAGPAPDPEPAPEGQE